MLLGATQCNMILDATQCNMILGATQDIGIYLSHCLPLGPHTSFYGLHFYIACLVHSESEGVSQALEKGIKYPGPLPLSILKISLPCSANPLIAAHLVARHIASGLGLLIPIPSSFYLQSTSSYLAQLMHKLQPALRCVRGQRLPPHLIHQLQL